MCDRSPACLTGFIAACPGSLPAVAIGRGKAAM